MKYPTNFTFLGFNLNSLIDSGEVLKLDETHNKITERKLFVWLQEKFENRIDISPYTKKELMDLEEFFGGLSWSVDETKNMLINKNGLCLLVAYCFEGIQQKPE